MSVTIDTIRAAQSDLDTGTDSLKTLVSSLLGFRPGLVSNTAGIFVSNSTGNCDTNTYTIPANTLVAGSCYLAVGFLTIGRGATTTASAATISGLFGGAVQCTGAGFPINTVASSQSGGIVMAAFSLISAPGTTATGIMRILSIGQWGASSGTIVSADLTGANGFTVNTTVSNTINLRVVMSVAVASLATTWSSAWVMRIK